jgi:hypothetical protein
VRKHPTIFFLSGLLILFLTASVFAAGKKEKPKKAPAFPRKGIWLNVDSRPKNIFQKRVTLVYFWGYTVINNLRELGILKSWFNRYKDDGFDMIFIHAPEFEFAKSKDNVEKAIKRLGIANPVFLDNDFKLWDKYEARSWPTKYLVNEQGAIFFTQVGEGHYWEMEHEIRRALEVLRPGVVLPEPVFSKPSQDPFDPEICGLKSEELYLGYDRAGWWGGGVTNKRWVLPNQTANYRDRGERDAQGFFAEGRWTNKKESFEHADDTEVLTDYLGLIYLAHEVYTVMNLEEPEVFQSTRIYVSRDDAPVPADQRGRDLKEDSQGATYFDLAEPRLYYLIRNENEDPHELKLWTLKKGVEVNAFSFSNRCLSDFEHL